MARGYISADLIFTDAAFKVVLEILRVRDKRHRDVGIKTFYYAKLGLWACH